MQLQWACSQLIEGRRQLKAVLEKGDPRKDVEAQPSSGHSYH